MKTKKTIAGIINILLAAIMVLSLASCGDKASAFSKKIDAMEAAAKSGNRADFDKAASETVVFIGNKLKLNIDLIYGELSGKDKNGKLTELVDRMLEVGLSAPAQSEEDFEFQLSDDGNSVIITGYKYTGYYSYNLLDVGSADEYKGKNFIVIPSEIQGLPVTEVSNFDKTRGKVLTIFVPGSVKKCGGMGNCYNIKFAEGVEKVHGFYDEFGGMIRKVELPSSLKTIGSSAFEGQKHLESINFGSNLIAIGKSAFKDCKNLKEVTLPDSLITIDDFAFYNSGLKSVSLPSNLKLIGGCVFAYTAIENITVPDSVKWLGTGSFVKCNNLKSISLPSSLKGIFYNWDTDTYPTEIVKNCNNLETLELAEGFNPVFASFQFAAHSEQWYMGEIDYTDMFKGQKIDANLSLQKTLKSHAPFKRWKCGTESSYGKEYWGLKTLAYK